MSRGSPSAGQRCKVHRREAADRRAAPPASGFNRETLIASPLFLPLLQQCHHTPSRPARALSRTVFTLAEQQEVDPRPSPPHNTCEHLLLAPTSGRWRRLTFYFPSSYLISAAHCLYNLTPALQKYKRRLFARCARARSSIGGAGRVLVDRRVT